MASKKRKVDKEAGDGTVSKKHKADENAITDDNKAMADSNRKAKLRRQLLFQREVEIITKDEDFPLPTEEQGKAFLVGLTGRRKSGKTHFLDVLMKTMWKQEFHKIYVLSKTAKHQQKFFGTWKGDIKYVEQWDDNFFNKIRDEAIADKKPKKRLIIIDDMSSKMREKIYASNIDEFSFIGRHFRVSVVWLAQKLTLFTPGFRQECDAFILFREENMSELRLLHKEWGFGNFDEFIVLLIENTLEKYSWVMLRNVGGTIKVLRLPPQKEVAKKLRLGSKNKISKE